MRFRTPFKIDFSHVKAAGHMRAVAQVESRATGKEIAEVLSNRIVAGQRITLTAGTGHPSFRINVLPPVVAHACADESINKRNGTVPIQLIHTYTQAKEVITVGCSLKGMGAFRIGPHYAWHTTGRCVCNRHEDNTRMLFGADLKNTVSELPWCTSRTAFLRGDIRMVTEQTSAGKKWVLCRMMRTDDMKICCTSE